MESQQRIESLYTEALEAMRTYAGQPPKNSNSLDLDEADYKVVRDEVVF